MKKGFISMFTIFGMMVSYFSALPTVVLATTGFETNFSTYTLGVLNGQDSWVTGTNTANCTATIAADPKDANNQCIKIQRSGDSSMYATRSFPAISGAEANNTATVQFRFMLGNDQGYEGGLQIRSGSKVIADLVNKYTNNAQRICLYQPAIGQPAGTTSKVYHSLLSWTGSGTNVKWYNYRLDLNFTQQTLDIYVGAPALPSTPTIANIPFVSAGISSVDNVNLYISQYAQFTNYFDDFSIANASADPTPSPSPTPVPTPLKGWSTVPLGGGGYVTGVVSNSNGSVIYCRTDVGGAFRWSPAADGVNGTWVSITDNIVPYGIADGSGLMSVDGIGTDPNNENQLYMGVGSSGGGLRGVFSSNDQGATWTQINNMIRMIGNGDYRSNGERLAVDPNNSNIVWYGSCLDGLQKGVKNNNAWTWTQIPSESVPLGATNAGVTFVVCDKNDGVNTIVYAGVTDSTVGGVYKSEDGGTTWSKVSGAAVAAPRRAQISQNGTLYVTGGTAGLFKLTRGGTLTSISSLPIKDYNNKTISYHAVAVDPNVANGDVVYVAQGSEESRSRIWRSSNGGISWAQQDSTFNEGPATLFNQSRREPDGTYSKTGYWFGSIASMLVNPSNSNQLFVSDYFGVLRTNNAQDIGTNPGAWWYTLQKGQEETCVLDIKNAPTGPKLMTGMGDVGGFRYQTDTNTRPSSTSNGNVTSLDFCESNQNVWARTWVENNVYGSPGSGGVSSDGGVNWLRFGQVTTKNVTNSSSANWESFDISKYLTKLKEKNVNTVTLAIATSNTPNYSSNVLSFSSNNASDETIRPKLVLNDSTNINPIADTYVNSSSPNSNFGESQFLYTSYAFGQSAYSKWLYLKFDLSSVSSISSAVLQLYRNSAANTTVFPIGVYACTNTTWVEGNNGTDNLPENEMTWNNKPPVLGGNSEPQSPEYYDGSKQLSGGRIAVSSVNPDYMVWLPINAVPYYSNDRGISWTASTGAPTSLIANIYGNGNSTSSSSQPLTADRANGYFYYAQFGGGNHLIYRSTDNGVTWTQVASVNNGGSFNMRAPQIVAAPVSTANPDGGDVWMCDDGTYNLSGGGLWRSRDAGVTWPKISTVDKVSQISFGKSATGNGYTIFINGYVKGVQGIYQSDDYGVTWSRIKNPFIKDVAVLAGDRQNYGQVFVGTNGRGTFQLKVITDKVESDKIGIYTGSTNLGTIPQTAGQYRIAATYYNDSGSNQVGYCIITVKSNNRLIDVKVIPKVFVPNEECNFTSIVNLPSSEESQNLEVKAVLWKDLTSIKPITLPLTISR